MYFPPSESTFATTEAKEGRPSDPLHQTVSPDNDSPRDTYGAGWMVSQPMTIVGF